MEMEYAIARETFVTRTGLSTRLITYGAFASFFLLGFTDNLKGAVLPAVLRDLHLNYADGGLIVFANALGFFLMSVTAGPFVDIVGKKIIMLLGCACIFSGLAGYGSFGSLAMLIAAMCVAGLGSGAFEVGANMIIVDLYGDSKGQYLNLLAFFHSVGAMIAPLYAGRLLTAGYSWRFTYQTAFPLLGLLFLYFLLLNYPHTRNAARQQFSLKQIGKSAFTAEMILYALSIAVYVAVEVGIASWVVEFLQKTKSQSVMMSSLMLSLFFGMITTGRFLGSFIVERIGYKRILFYASIAAAVCVAAGTFGPTICIWCFALSGLFFSIMFPTITAAVSDNHPENTGTMLGILFMFGGIGAMFGPWAVGVLSKWSGIYAGFSLLTGLSVLMSSLFFLLQSRRAIHQEHARR